MSSAELQNESALDLLDFDNHRDFLKAELARRRSRRSSWTLRQFARRAGFSSPSILSMIISGQRPLTEKSADKIAKALHLVGRRKTYLLTLGKLDSAETEEEKQKFRDQLMQIKSAVDESLIEVSQYKFLTEWFYIVIYVMIGQKGFRDDPIWIRSKLHEPVELDKIEQALKDLEALKLIEKKEGQWVQCEQAISTPEDVLSTAVYIYHKRMTELAGRALDLPLKKREFNGLTIAVPQEQLPWVKEKIRVFRKELNEHLSQFLEPSDVYQLNVQLFPLTGGLEEK